MDYFDRFHPAVREFVYDKKWGGLRGIQSEAAAAIYDSPDHLLIAAGTASGKTEAALFPIMSILAGAASGSGVGALYVSPLKALINDQAERLEPLAEKAGVPLTKWHGDVPGGRKEKLLEHPEGMLQITPESLESLLCRRFDVIQNVFGRLAFVIVDEIHSFIGTARGQQLLCLLARIEKTGARPRRVGLLATLADYSAAAAWLAGGSAKVTIISGDGERKRKVRIAVDCFSRKAGEENDFYCALLAETANKRCIIFTNSRIEAEECVAALKERAGAAGTFLVHHGSVSAALRGGAEKILREHSGPVTLAATATLEMGMDIGDLDRVIQLGPPLSVSSFVQRLGRCGRRSGVSEMYFSDLVTFDEGAAIPWPLVKTIAVIELYIKEKWIEDSAASPLPFSMLVHETLATLRAEGEKTVAQMEEEVPSLPGFASITKADYRLLLKAMLREDLIEQTEDGVIIGLTGEKICGSFHFYSVFPGDEQYKVTHNGAEIGTVNFAPEPGASIALGGRYWRVLRFDRRSREIVVEAGGEFSPRLWHGGGAQLHPRTARKMRQVLRSDERYSYLTPRAAAMLDAARAEAEKYSVGRNVFINMERVGSIHLFRMIPFLGSRGMKTLSLVLKHSGCARLLKIEGLAFESEYSVLIRSKLGVPEFAEELKRIVKQLTENENDLRRAVFDSEPPFTEKYDQYLPPELLARQYAAAALDIDELRSIEL